MTRNLDITSLRSFVAIADAGGVTRAAGFLNLTQSAVSMQIKRLEDMLGCAVLDRSARKVQLTAAGEALLSYARRMLVLNDEVFGRLTQTQHEGEVVLGVPHDIVYPVIPQILRRFAAEYPRMKVTLLSSFTRVLKGQFSRGDGCCSKSRTRWRRRNRGRTAADLGRRAKRRGVEGQATAAGLRQ